MQAISFEQNMAIEFLASLSRYAHDDAFAKAIKGAGYRADPGIAQWVKKVRQDISAYHDGEVRYLFGLSQVNSAFLVRTIAEKGITDCDQLLAAADSTTAEEYVRGFTDALGSPLGVSREEMAARLEGAFDKKTATALLEMVGNPTETLQRIASAARKFYDAFFRPVEAEIAGVLEEKNAAYLGMDQGQRASFLKSMINASVSDWAGGDDIRIFLSHFHEASANLIRCGAAGAVIVMGYQLVDLMGADAMENRRKQFYKVLSDDKRLEILKLISKRSWYGNELASHLGITTATLSYHISKLFELGVVNFRGGEQNRVYYSADTEKLKSLFEKALQDILG